ncbi:MAG: stage V sporulation protein T [Oscillospiraceae bacterium]|nr:stage V sporulation protein T [Oscillospiraceae bacterium]
MKATGIVRRIDDLGRVVIPKEIRRTLRIRDGDPSLTTLADWEIFCFGVLELAKRTGYCCT